MKIKFFGAAGIVTGSCHMLMYNNKKILVDCGMYQGPKEVSRLNYQPFQFDPKEIELVILTHAHIDHSGLIPKLYKHGFRGKVYCTKTTKDLCKIMLEDSAGIQEFETKWDNKRLKKQGMPLRKPLYNVSDAKRSMSLFRGKEYDKLVKVDKDLEIVFRDAGHIIGSSIVEVFIKEKKVRKFVFSGDLGQIDAPIIKDPTFIKTADYVICESTYGSRKHEDPIRKEKILQKAIQKTWDRSGKLIIPSFAIERTQEIIYRINRLSETGVIPDIPIFVDSPLGVRATKIFRKHTENYDDETVDMIAKGDDPFHFPKLRYIIQTEESKALNTFQGPCVIISASGMCTGGRVKHHIKNHAGSPTTIILFVGYQARGTLGRRIRNGEKNVRIYGQNYRINAEIMEIEGFSSHADQPQLLGWLRNFEGNPEFIFVHGEPEESKALKKKFGKGHIAKMYEELILK